MRHSLLPTFVLTASLLESVGGCAARGPNWVEEPKYPVYTPEGGVIDRSPDYKPPRVLKHEGPQLPPGVLERGVDKKVILSFIVDEKGHVKDVRVVVTAGREIDALAIAALAKWQYEPAQLGGNPTAVVQSATFTFHW